ncbi:alpha/beta fold hydrolase [Streptomyces somaliensis DSM 40738]|uniref:Alpha/beta fold hydrolase n=1 Tax=Streptomyces somaliensis (strain ATCC 33201 / DSM 40738 / JCM 12659 / KCTC 9044 / NCTC 11332 / NRRL B-12077 / IP 733) TaxID=1134445 RepID=A0AA44IBV1_STRE0|nr:alpha/beta hydrolase [Streptomyces somaliensis]MCQ0024545.1 alpha/beta fold hydrolase [Streptomyces somaliensis DSM 40738]NKY13015.1 alpha/beta fold hydrolase [Streptomyces somaliensis DSM 40738]
MHREHFVDAAPGVRLWVEERGDPEASALLLVMGAQASGLGWPDELVDALAAHHRVIRYDHRDTGRSTWSYETEPYAITDLAADALAVLDGLGVERAHVVGMSLGGMLAQLLLADHPERVRTATLIGTCALSTTPYTAPDGTVTPVGELPPVDPRILEVWARLPEGPGPEGGPEDDLDRRVEHWRLLNGEAIPFDAEAARDMERRVLAHTGHARVGTAHGRADQSGMLRTEALASTRVPTLVVSAPAEPVFPPPHAQHLAQVIRGAELVEIPGMGHALPRPVLEPLAEAVLRHTAA